MSDFYPSTDKTGIEVVFTDKGVLISDAKLGGYSKALLFSHDDWSSLVKRVQSGEFALAERDRQAQQGRECRDDCDEIPGYCASGSGCLGGRGIPSDAGFEERAEKSPWQQRVEEQAAEARDAARALDREELERQIRCVQLYGYGYLLYHGGQQIALDPKDVTVVIPASRHIDDFDLHNSLHLTEQRVRELERRIEAMVAATFIADEEDHTDWQRGYRACSERVRFAFEAPLPPQDLLKEKPCPEK